MNSIDRLTEMFARFPGIGPRQAKRFVYYLLSRNSSQVDELVRAIQALRREIVQCDMCLRHFAKNGHATLTCSICSDIERDASLLCVVHKDIDLEAVERSGTFRGYYFVLGGAVPILEKEPEKRIRIKSLEARIKSNPEIKEVVLALNANAEGENTADYIKEKLNGFDIEITLLGRGLSTGVELEYADPETLKNAFLHRTK
jgi:recombination protein RecR